MAHARTQRGCHGNGSAQAFSTGYEPTEIRLSSAELHHIIPLKMWAHGQNSVATATANIFHKEANRNG